jgi:membrane fusion protein (multidrug efflux system)
MAAARDQAARIVRVEPDTVGDEPSHDAAAILAEQLRGHLADETVSRRPAETPDKTVTDKPAAAPAMSANPAASKPGKRKLVLPGILVLVALAAAAYGVHYLLVGRFYISTDDAYVRANNTTLGARVSGHLSAILAGDNSLVRAGEVVFKIDDGDYRIAVDAATTKIATQQATIDRIGRQIAALESAVDQAKAQVVSAEAGLKRAGLDFDRQQSLSDKGFASRATFEVSEATRDQGVAALKSAQAAFDAARVNVDVAKAQQVEARAQLAEFQTTLAKAQRDLDFTSVRAPVDGTFSNRLVSTGDYIVVGQRLGNVVPLDDVFIDANFKPGPAGDDLGRRLWPPQVRRHRRQHFAGGGFGVHAAAAGQCHRKFHQDRAAAAGPGSRAGRRGAAEPAARRHVGVCHRRHPRGRQGC